MRLHRYVAQCGLTSRRKAEEWIAEGRVQVNGETVTTPGTTVGEGDEVRVDGEVAERPRPMHYVLNKPVGCLTTMSDPRGRPTVMSLLPAGVRGLKPVGRLDLMTSGLLLATNDGAFAALVSHPGGGLEKEYVATVAREPSDRDLDRLVRGVRDSGETLRAEAAWLDRPAGPKAPARVRIILVEGRNRQVRRMLEGVGCPVQQLERVRIGPLRVRGMRPGECRKLSQAEVEALAAAVRRGKRP
jgi:23S rRNA pseudouridine2605 synthase